MRHRISQIARRSQEAGTEEIFRPQLTSMIDVMTVLLVFLIQSFSAEGELVTPNKGVNLPGSTATEKAQQVLTIAVTKDSLLLSGTAVASLASFRTNSDLMIAPLQKRLEALPKVQRRSAMIEADRDLPFAVIKRVMFTMSRSGVEHYALLTRQEAK